MEKSLPWHDHSRIGWGGKQKRKKEKKEQLNKQWRADMSISVAAESMLTLGKHWTKLFKRHDVHLRRDWNPLSPHPFVEGTSTAALAMWGSHGCWAADENHNTAEGNGANSACARGAEPTWNKRERNCNRGLYNCFFFLRFCVLYRDHYIVVFFYLHINNIRLTDSSDIYLNICVPSCDRNVKEKGLSNYKHKHITSVTL